MYLADALSRWGQHHKQSHNLNSVTNWKKCHSLNIYVPIPGELMEQLRDETVKDTSIQILMQVSNNRLA